MVRSALDTPNVRDNKSADNEDSKSLKQRKIEGSRDRSRSPRTPLLGGDSGSPLAPNPFFLLNSVEKSQQTLVDSSSKNAKSPESIMGKHLAQSRSGEKQY